jgi:5-methylcytosine-specific restriction endonuclease McrA
VRRSRERGGITSAELLAWESAQRKVCHWCGAKCASYEIDHRQPLARGGKHEARNLVSSCRPCNRRKGARDPIEFAQSSGKLL